MLIVQNRRFKKQYVIGGSGIFDSVIRFLVRTFSGPVGKEVGKAALDVGKQVTSDAGKKLIEKVINPKPTKKVEDIVAKYTQEAKNPIAIQNLVKKVNGSGHKVI